MATEKKQGYFVTIQPDGTETREPFKGREPPYERLRQLVGGCVALAPVKYEGRKRNAYVHDEGLLIGLPVNPRASTMYKEAHPGMVAFDPKFGSLFGTLVIIVWEKM